MEPLAKTVPGFQLLTISEKGSILENWQVLNMHLNYLYKEIIFDQHVINW